MDRRTFLKAAGLGSIAVAYGCNSNTDRNIYSLVTAPDDQVTGEAAWYASTCMECPAGCGVIAKNREGRVIKLEGNPTHPVNQGKLCIRGQAALQSVYDPDRLQMPQLKTNGAFKAISFEQAAAILKEKMQASSRTGTNRIKMLTGMASDPLFSLFSTVLKDFHSTPAALYEPYSHDTLKNAHQALFSMNVLPSFHMEKADVLLNFGADFIETWLSPVEYIRKFKSMHALKNGQKGVFIHAGPYMSLTGANADKFLLLDAGKESVAAMGLIRRILEERPCDHLPADFLTGLKAVAARYDEAFVEIESKLDAMDQRQLADTLLSARRPLILGSAGISNGRTSLALDMAATLINLLLDKDLSLYDFENRHAVEKAMTAKQTAGFFQATAKDPTDILLMFHTNPLFTFPSNSYLEDIFRRGDIFKVSFSNFIDETSRQSDLVFPVQLPLETWDTFESRSHCISTLQPTMGQLTQAPSIGDVFLELSGPDKRFENYYQYIAAYLYENLEEKTKEEFIGSIQKGGIFHRNIPDTFSKPSLNLEALQLLGQALTVENDTAESERTRFSPLLGRDLTVEDPSKKEELKFMAVPSLRLYDGRGANESWLSEIPDPVTNIAWETMLMIHPETLEAFGFNHGDILSIQAADNAIEAPVYAYKGVSFGLIVMQTGQGHTAFGRYAEGHGSSPVKLLSGDLDTLDYLSYLIRPDSVKKTGTAQALPRTDGSRSQYKRKIALSMTAKHRPHEHEAKQGLTMNEFPLTLPYEAGYDEKRDVNPPHSHEEYRWGMIVDLDRCVGCSACVAACYAENNIGVVGKTQIIKGREMSWLRIERYQDQTFDDRLIFLPMLCQHCDNAPCESVCPVYAPHHSKEGINNQIYNRCIGTRFCAQNCPYKVRRFNWFEWKWPNPLNLQLNPNVTARTKGVMEKCSFCIQRIKHAHNQAKNENRKIRDMEILPACVQTCPANALTFGNFLDKDSAVSKLARDPRAYQVLGYLNTKPAVIYLKKMVQDL